MENTEKRKNRFGLLGKDIAYSFSQSYFKNKFDVLGLEHYSYENFDIAQIEDFLTINRFNLRGFNVTIPYKEAIIPYLDSMDEVATNIGAVNTVKIVGRKLHGFNTDASGFDQAISAYLKPHHKQALILGTGGASQAIKYVLSKKNINYSVVSRTPKCDQLSYSTLTPEVINSHQIIINCTPVGTFPAVDDLPHLPYELMTKQHLLFDLIYNPPKTAFLTAGATQGAVTVNGSDMLTYQAEKSWDIWQNAEV